MGVEDVGPLPADYGQQVARDPGIEAVPPQADGAEALLLQVSRGLIRWQDTDQSDVELLRVEAREPPAEEPGDAVGAGPADPELVAQVEDADLRWHGAIGPGWGRGNVTPASRTRLACSEG